MRHNKNRTALNSLHAVLLVALFGASPAFACGDQTPDPATGPPVVLPLAM